MTGPAKPGGGSGSGRGRRDLRVRVKTARGRKLSSTLWLERQLNDPYVARAQAEGYRSRAAFKLSEIDDRFGFLKPGARVVDLGCAPGGWVQVAVARVNALGAAKGRAAGRVLGIDLQAVEPIAGAELWVLDFLDEAAPERIRGWLAGPADVVLSDMAAPASGHPQTGRHLRCQGAGRRRRPGAGQVAAPELRQAAARQAAGEPEGFVGEVPGGDGVSRAGGRVGDPEVGLPFFRRAWNSTGLS